MGLTHGHLHLREAYMYVIGVLGANIWYLGSIGFYTTLQKNFLIIKEHSFSSIFSTKFGNRRKFWAKEKISWKFIKAYIFPAWLEVSGDILQKWI